MSKYIEQLREAEAKIYEQAYHDLRFNQTRTAIALGVSRGTFRRKMNYYFGEKYIVLGESEK